MPFHQFPKICPVCLELSECKFVTDYQSKDGNFSLYECLKCNVQFWLPFKNPGQQWYEAQEKYRPKKPQIYRGYHKKFLELYSVFSPSIKVLEVGCGTGELLYEVEKRGGEIWGVDLDKIDIEVAGQYFKLKNIYAMSFEDFFLQPHLPRFDLVVFFETIEHLDNPLKFIRSVKNVLKPNGRIILSTPSRQRMWVNLYEWDFPPYHLTRWDVISVSKLFRKINFEIASIYYTDQYIHFQELCRMFTEKIIRRVRLFGFIYKLVPYLFIDYLFTKFPAAVFFLVGKIFRKKNGVMVIKLVAK